MPIDYSKYPANWHKISYQIRFNRAVRICECTGQCGSSHRPEALLYTAGIFRDLNIEIPADRCHAMHNCQHPVTNARVVLTVAHLCECEPLCADPAHLLAMCQRCHLRLDREQHARNAARTRQRRRLQSQPQLFSDEFQR